MRRRQAVEKLKQCIECKDKKAVYAGGLLCEECWREFLQEKIEEDVEV